MTSNPNAKNSPQYLILARVLRPHGIRGDLRIQIITNFPERLSNLENIYMGLDPDKPEKFARHRVTSARPDRANHWLIHIRGVDNRDAAEKFREQYLMVSLADAVPLEEDEVYLFQVLGLEVRTQEGEALGKVTDIIETGANDVYVVQGGSYGEVLIPAISGVIVDISPETGLMLVNPPPGLLPDPTDIEQDTSPDED